VCSSERTRDFEGAYRFHLQGRKVTRNQQKRAVSRAQLSELPDISFRIPRNLRSSDGVVQWRGDDMGAVCSKKWLWGCGQYWSEPADDSVLNIVKTAVNLRVPWGQEFSWPAERFSKLYLGARSRRKLCDTLAKAWFSLRSRLSIDFVNVARGSFVPVSRQLNRLHSAPNAMWQVLTAPVS
jgi:hypothetical protein